jgi:ABC-type nitrate/sulfonate/bicarbonate transport system substrate-binding protein
VSYGGTAGYQLPLWVNKEFGFSRKYGVDLEIILIQAGSPNIQALVGGSLQLTQTAAFVSNSSGPWRAGGDRRHLGK